MGPMNLYQSRKLTFHDLKVFLFQKVNRQVHIKELFKISYPLSVGLMTELVRLLSRSLKEMVLMFRQDVGLSVFLIRKSQ